MTTMACRALAFLCLVLADSVEVRVGDLPCGSTVSTLNFSNAHIVNNNLGGEGPNSGDPEEIRYDNLGHMPDGTPIGLKVTEVTPNQYQAANINRNGVFNGMGQINVAGNSTVLLEFQFIDSSDGSDLCLGNAGVTFYDVDGGRHVSDHQQYEVISVCPAETAILSDGYNPPNNVPTGLELAPSIVNGCKAYRAKQPITNELDPVDIANLNEAQLSHTLTEMWTKLCHFQVYFQSVNGPAISGRNFWFTGLAAQTNECPCEDQTCGICEPGQTCAEAIACKMEELTNGFDSNGGGEPPEDQCDIALAAVVASCPNCDECESCPTTRVLDDAARARGSGAAAERGPLLAALAVMSCFLVAVSGVAAAFAVHRMGAFQPQAVATASDAQSETDGQLS